jgi:uncharacterized protein
MILVDTGPLVAAANRKDADHDASVNALADAHAPRLVPCVVIAEVAYLLARDAGAPVEAAFLRSFGTGFLTVVESTVADLNRAADLVEQYADLSLGTTDACLRGNRRAPRRHEARHVGSPALQRRATTPRAGADAPAVVRSGCSRCGRRGHGSMASLTGPKAQRRASRRSSAACARPICPPRRRSIRSSVSSTVGRSAIRHSSPTRNCSSPCHAARRATAARRRCVRGYP